jgi:hypothetical protein
MHLAQSDAAVKQILDRQKDTAMTIAGVQLVLLQEKSGKIS